MSKTIITFLFSLIILASIVAPTFVNFSESTIEITEIVDFGEEEENKGNYWNQENGNCPQYENV